LLGEKSLVKSTRGGDQKVRENIGLARRSRTRRVLNIAKVRAFPIHYFFAKIAKRTE